MKRAGLVLVLVCSMVVLAGCENISFSFKYGDWGFSKEIKLKEIKTIDIKIEEIKDNANKDVANPQAPLVAPQPTAPSDASTNTTTTY